MIVLIDNGHGANTPGKCSPDKQIREYSYAREIASLLEQKLKEKGITATRIVTEENDVPLNTRASRVNTICREFGAQNCCVVEYLSFTQDYTFALDTTYKITLKETAKTSATKPVVVLYQIYDLISKGDGLKIYTSPTVTDQGTVIEKYYLPGATGVGTSRYSSGVGDDWEIILRPNAKDLS